MKKFFSIIKEKLFTRVENNIPKLTCVGSHF